MTVDQSSLPTWISHWARKQPGLPTYRQSSVSIRPTTPCCTLTESQIPAPLSARAHALHVFRDPRTTLPYILPRLGRASLPRRSR